MMRPFKLTTLLFSAVQLLYWQRTHNRNLKKLSPLLATSDSLDYQTTTTDSSIPLLSREEVKNLSCNGVLPPELHAVILWRGSQDVPRAKKVLEKEAKSGRTLELVQTLDLSALGEERVGQWCYVMYAGGRHVQPRCKKEGRGQPFPAVLVVRDDSPTYQWHKSGHPESPPQYMNTKLRKYKKELRSALKMHPSFLGAHSSTNVEEAVAALEVLQRWMPDQFQSISSLRPVTTRTDTREEATGFEILEEAIGFANSFPTAASADSGHAGCTRTAQTGMPYPLVETDTKTHKDASSGAEVTTPVIVAGTPTDVFTNNYFDFKIVTGAHATDPFQMREVGRKDTTSTAAWIPLKNGKQKQRFLQVRSLDDGHVCPNWVADSIATANPSNGLMAPVHAGFMGLYLLHTYPTQKHNDHEDRKENKDVHITTDQAEFISTKLNGIRVSVGNDQNVPFGWSAQQIMENHPCVRMALYLFMQDNQYTIHWGKDKTDSDTKSKPNQKRRRSWWKDFANQGGTETEVVARTAKLFSQKCANQRTAI